MQQHDPAADAGEGPLYRGGGGAGPAMAGGGGFFQQQQQQQQYAPLQSQAYSPYAGSSEPQDGYAGGYAGGGPMVSPEQVYYTEGEGGEWGEQYHLQQQQQMAWQQQHFTPQQQLSELPQYDQAPPQMQQGADGRIYYGALGQQ